MRRLSVLLDGELVNSCLTPAAQADGGTITTIEGVASENDLHAVQEPSSNAAARSAASARRVWLSPLSISCPGFPSRAEADVRAWLGGNLCRCTGYMRIFESVLHAWRQRSHDVG